MTQNPAFTYQQSPTSILAAHMTVTAGDERLMVTIGANTLQQRFQQAMMLACAVVLAGCTVAEAPPQPIAIAPQAPPAPPVNQPEPTPEETATAEIMWALRGGLNVAALVCNDRAMTNDYNQMLKMHRNLLNDAYAAEQARYRTLHGTAGPARHDVAMTRLYNGFASVPDRRRFCLAASRILADATAIPSHRLAGIARRALVTLEPGALQLISSRD
jgi:hypothetical protein